MFEVFNPSYDFEEIQSQAKRNIVKTHNELLPYLFEAMIRNIMLSNEIKIAYGINEPQLNLPQNYDF